MRTFSGRKPSQAEKELEGFISLLQDRGVTRYLEIGARHGDTFHAVMSALPRGSTGVAVDLPNALWGHPQSVTALRRARDDLQEKGYAAHVILADSQSATTAEKVCRVLPHFDAVLIDGDHRYHGVKRDFELYGGLADLVAFHDIVGIGQRDKRSKEQVDVPRFWHEVKRGRESVSFIDIGSAMGIGVLCN